MPKKVCVFGSYKDPGKKEREDIIKLGRLLGEKGFEVMTGGFGGAMELVSRGAKEAGGKTLGVTYYRYSDTDKKPNKYIDKEIRAKDIFERVAVMMKNADAFIVLAGGTGTLLELAACLEHMNKGLMKPKPIIALGDWWKGVAERLAGEAVLSEGARSYFNARSARDLITFAETAKEAVDSVMRLPE